MFVLYKNKRMRLIDFFIFFTNKKQEFKIKINNKLIKNLSYLTFNLCDRMQNILHLAFLLYQNMKYFQDDCC